MRTPEQITELARLAYLYGYPTVDAYAILHRQALDPGSPEFKAPFNCVGHARNVATPEDRAIVAPNVDTPYSYAWFDLRAEPVVITIPPFDAGRYVSLTLFDLYTYILGYVSPRTNGNAGGDFLLTGPDYDGATPEGIKGVFASPTQLAYGLYRTQLVDASDLPNVHAIQDGFRVRTLSEYLGQVAPPAPPPLTRVASVDVRKEMGSLRFFEVLNAVLAYMPPMDSERELRDAFAEIGVAGGATFAPEANAADGFRQGMAAALEEMYARAKTVRSSAELFGSREYLGQDYLIRAVGALLGIFGNAAEEYLGVGYQTDADGETFNGRHQYRIKFEADKLPPVGAFWSICVYTAEKWLYANEMKRYVVNSPMVA
ncbi:MAG: DUF1254 domain-containing protein, partial [Anaerolineae bacterium]|nr:DUF1254 domain-containing protein [Anaerolineae bacterium]